MTSSTKKRVEPHEVLELTHDLKFLILGLPDGINTIFKTEKSEAFGSVCLEFSLRDSGLSNQTREDESQES